MVVSKQGVNLLDTIIDGNTITSSVDGVDIDAGSVSYTHLDVYKRQVMVCSLTACGQQETGIMTKTGNSTEQVVAIRRTV